MRGRRTGVVGYGIAIRISACVGEIVGYGMPRIVVIDNKLMLVEFEFVPTGLGLSARKWWKTRF
jgi:hypothetical protein